MADYRTERWMMRNRTVLAVGAGALIVMAAAVAIPAATGEWVLFDLPRGSWLASVRAGAPVEVLEEKEGWRRVRIEGWVAVSPEAAAAPVGAKNGAGITVEGIVPPGGAGSATPATRLVLLVAGLPDLDLQHAELGAECRPPIAAGAAEVERLKKEAGQALNSSDNFRQAAEAKDRARAAAAKAEREQRDRVTTCRARAEDLFQRHAAARGFSDSAGKFRFDGVPPGAYRVIVLDPAGDLAIAAALECRVDPPGPVTLDPGAHKSAMQPFWDLR